MSLVLKCRWNETIRVGDVEVRFFPGRNKELLAIIDAPQDVGITRETEGLRRNISVRNAPPTEARP